MEQQFYSTKKSLFPKFHRPHSPPNAYTDEKFRRNPKISVGELNVKIRTTKGY